MPDREKVISLVEDAIEIVEKEAFWTIANGLRDALVLLKEQGSIEPVLDETTKRFYRCGACGEYVGFIDSDPGDPNEQDNYCRNCGRVVKWN